jgi:hypothetical protein
MKGNGRITGYTVNKKTIKFDTFQLAGKIGSITIRRNLGFLIHTAKIDFINRRLFHLMEKDPLTIRVSTIQQDKLLYLLDTIAGKRSQKPEDLLFELTSFTKKDGDGPEKTIPGKKSVFDLSDAQLIVVFDKIKRLPATT